MPRTFRSKNLGGSILSPDERAAMKLKNCLLRTLRWLLCTDMDIEQQFDTAIYRRQLAELKADLCGALTELEAHEKQISKVVKESSRLAMYELENGLKEILQQVERMKQKGSA
jgi:hypothetical protein